MSSVTKARILVTLLLAVSVCVVQGCGSSTSTPTTVPAAPTKAPAAATQPAASSPELDALLTKLFGDAKVDEFTREVLTFAAQSYSEAEKELAIKCYKEESCQTGRGTLTVAFHNGYTDNSWMNEVVMNFILQAIRYPEVKKIILTRARGDNTKALSDLRSLIVQKPDIIVSLHALGPAALPTMKEAMQAGITLVTFNTDTGGVVGQDMSAEVPITWAPTGTMMAQLIAKDLNGKGTVAIILGPAGFPPEQKGVDAMMEVFKQYPNLEVLPAVNTDWSSENVFKAMSSLLARYPRIDAIYQSFGDSQRGAIRAYHQAGRALDVVSVHHNVTNGLYGDWVNENNPNFKLYVSSGGNWGSRVALHIGLLLKLGKPTPTTVSIPFEILPADKKYYDASLPESFNPHGAVPGDVVKKMYE